MGISWDQPAEKKFTQLLEKIPIFLRDTAKDRVGKRAEKFAVEANRSEITEKDLVDAFFKETPFGFHGPMKTDMQALGIDYQKHGYER